MRQISFRLNPGVLFKEAVEQAVKDHGIKAGVILAASGALEKTVIRMAGSTAAKQDIRNWPGPFEIVAVNGTLSPDGCHLHVALADSEGIVHGGHLMPGSVVGLTAEVVLLAFDDVSFTRAMNAATGFPELEIKGIV